MSQTLVGLPGNAASGRSEFLDHLKDIEELYQISGIQSVAVGAFVNAVMASGLRFSKSKKPVRGMLLSAISEFIRNLCLYGFVSYRILDTEADVGTDDIAVQVPSGADVPVRFSSTLLRWVPDLTQKGSVSSGGGIFGEETEETDDDEDADEPGRWKCVVWMPPGEKRCSSFGAMSQPDAQRIEEIYQNLANRDNFNSRPAAFVSISEGDFSARGRAGGQTFLKSGLDIDSHTGEEGTTRGLNYEELISTRAAVMRGLAENTDRKDYAAEAAEDAYRRTGTGLRGDSIIPERDAYHRELAITEGRKATQVSALKGESDATRLITRLRLNVLEAFGVAPQSVGESVSSERVGSNAQATSKAMAAFEQTARVLRDQLPVEEFGLEWENRPPINVFERVFPLLTAKAARELTAAVFKLDPEYLDPKRIEIQQNAMIGAKGPASGNAPEGLKTEQRRHKTDFDKEITALNQGETFK